MRYWRFASSKGETFVVTNGDDPAAEGIDMRHWPQREELSEAEYDARQRAKAEDPAVRERLRRAAPASALSVGELEDLIERRAEARAAEAVARERPQIEEATKRRVIEELKAGGVKVLAGTERVAG